MREAILIAKNRRPYSPIISGSRRRTQRFAAFSLKTASRYQRRLMLLRHVHRRRVLQELGVNDQSSKGATIVLFRSCSAAGRMSMESASASRATSGVMSRARSGIGKRSFPQMRPSGRKSTRKRGNGYP
jgi:hypothetical protein